MTGFSHVVTALALLLGSIEPAPQPQAVVVVPGVPVLMYHVIADPPPGAAWPLLYVSAAEFDAQMAWLEQNGYEAVTLSDVWRNWHAGSPLPARPVVVTFDDGYLSVYRSALPTLSARGWPGVLNLKVGNVGESGGLSERHVRELVDSGWGPRAR